MAIKHVRETWSACQLDFVKEFVINKEADIAKLPVCCVGSKATVAETNNKYVCCADGSWKLESKALGEENTTDNASELYRIEATANENFEVDLDKDFQEIKAAVLAGKVPYIVCYDGSETVFFSFYGGKSLAPGYYSNKLHFYAVNFSIRQAAHITIEKNGDNTLEYNLFD